MPPVKVPPTTAAGRAGAGPADVIDMPLALDEPTSALPASVVRSETVDVPVDATATAASTPPATRPLERSRPLYITPGAVVEGRCDRIGGGVKQEAVATRT
jgi:hypothetical protein